METNYKRTVAGSVGAGVAAVFNGTGRQYYILEHKTESLYHHAGESQKIIVDQVELGRDSACQVRFDEAFETVSRRHAAIVKEGENWKIIPLSQTNTTLVNGQVITGETVLNSGDEIRLSSRGPLMGFIIPQGKQSLVSSIGMTERLNLFGKQALRPYKFALVTLIIVLLLAVGGLVYWNIYQNDINKAELDMNKAELAQANANLNSLKNDIEEKAETVITDKERYNDAVYYIKANNIEVYSVPGNRLLVDFNVEDGRKFHGGTGFMLEDGRFVTAHRVIEPWLYYDTSAYDQNGKLWTYKEIREAISSDTYRVVAHFTAYSPSGMNFQFRNTDFVTGASSYLTTENDWASMAKRDQLLAIKGLPFDSKLSLNPEGGCPVTIIGYPLQYGFKSSQDITPRYLPNNINVTGLNIDGVIELSSRRYQDGNDGAPVLVNNNGNWVVVGILSHVDEVKHDVAVPIERINE
jgi:hypothetical protein